VKATKKQLVLSGSKDDALYIMKKLLAIAALVSLLGSVLLVGCKKEEPAPEMPTPPTNAPTESK